MPPGLTTINGITYVVPGWHKVPADTTLKEVYDNWEQITYKDKDNNPSKKYVTKIKSNTGDKYYDVEFTGKIWTCTCVGYGYRGKCKHIEQAKNLTKN